MKRKKKIKKLETKIQNLRNDIRVLLDPESAFVDVFSIRLRYKLEDEIEQNIWSSETINHNGFVTFLTNEEEKEATKRLPSEEAQENL